MTSREKHPTRGSQAFSALVKEKHGKQKEIATELGFPQDQVSRWASGAHRPDARTRAVIEEKLGIGWRLWDEPVDEASNDVEHPGAA